MLTQEQATTYRAKIIQLIEEIRSIVRLFERDLPPGEVGDTILIDLAEVEELSSNLGDDEE